MSYTCPRCGMTSHNPNDEREGYCGNCHDWTREEATLIPPKIFGSNLPPEKEE